MQTKVREMKMFEMEISLGHMEKKMQIKQWST